MISLLDAVHILIDILQLNRNTVQINMDTIYNSAGYAYVHGPIRSSCLINFSIFIKNYLLIDYVQEAFISS
jgi:hypothetical protein